MNATVRAILTGLAIGLAPLILCTALFYGAPYLIDGNPGTLLSFAVMGLFIFSSIAVFIIGIVLLVKGKTAIGATALVVLGLQGIGLFAMLVVFTGYSS